MATTISRANQPPPLEGYDLYAQNRPLVEAAAREGAGWANDDLRALGTLLGGEPLEWGRLANENPPRLRAYDRFGERIDEVEFHPAWHELLRLGVAHALHAAPWREPRPGAHAARAAAFVTFAQVEAGVGCPLAMTFAAVPALRVEPELAAEWEPRLESVLYDPGLRPAADKAGALCGMAMTERQGGSDVRANEMEARPLSDDEATHHAAHRSAFGRTLIDQPLMLNVLADLCVDSEAATVLALRLARAYDEDDVAFRRLATTVAKYWVCKSTPPLVVEALECLGGNGYVEESVLPRLHRESPLNSLWEGAGNINALDVLRDPSRRRRRPCVRHAAAGTRARGDRRAPPSACLTPSHTKARKARTRRKARSRSFLTRTACRCRRSARCSKRSRSGASTGASCRWTTRRPAASTRRTTSSSATACTSSERRSCGSTTVCSRCRDPRSTNCRW